MVEAQVKKNSKQYVKEIEHYKCINKINLSKTNIERGDS